RSAVISKEKSPVSPDWSTERHAELVLFQSRRGGGKEVARIEGVVSQKLVQGPMKGVGSRLQLHADGDAAESLLRAEIVRLDLELLNGVGRRQNRGALEILVRDIDAVHDEHRVGRAHTVRAHGRAPDKARNAAEESSRGQRGELGEVAAVQRQVHDRTFADHLADHGALTLYERSLGSDIHQFGLLSDDQLE